MRMDWFSWLSRTNLEDSLTYEYGLSFSHNELEYEDIAYFNHEFLKSMGISIAKHRLEILKLARRHSKPSRSISRLLLNAIRKTGECFSEYVRASWIMRREESSSQALGRWSKRNKSNGNGSCASSKEERLMLMMNGTPCRLDSFSSSTGFDHYRLQDDVYFGKNLQEEVIIKWDSMFQNLKPT